MSRIFLGFSCEPDPMLMKIEAIPMRTNAAGMATMNVLSRGVSNNPMPKIYN